ncbi:MAG TPA: hypothetical protein P5234_12765 [Thermoanaerobaculaceae bacterium]|mgnify:CR=1 FL=1|nr:hypothetical protein [Thermoanaerobaculaceae bacterium]HRS17104.1 hypothetical protein [Thermoanaerobaculaceae bacterium]
MARTAGAQGSDWYTTLWVTNLSVTEEARVEIRFLRKDQANLPTPAPHGETLRPGETRRYDNVLESLFGAAQTSGALWIRADHDVLATSRTFDLHGPTDGRESRGHCFGGIPPWFAIGPQEMTWLQGVSLNGGEDFRYNFGMIETSGQGATLSVELVDGEGRTTASRSYALRPYEPKQVAVSTLAAGVATRNSILRATVTSSTGRVILYGTQMPNGSNDSAGFEMAFPARVLAGGSETTAATLAASAASTGTAVVDKLWAIAQTIALYGSYDEQTGWWTVDITLRNTASAHFQVQFRDAAGKPSRLFNPLLTTTVLTRGHASGVLGRVEYDFTLAGTNQGSDNLTVNGSGNVESQGIAASYTVIDLVQPKALHYPTAGTIVVTSGPIVVTVTFNGTNIATGTYTVGLVTRQFQINLDTGEVTFL